LQAIDADIKASGSVEVAVLVPEQASAPTGEIELSQSAEDEWQESGSTCEVHLSSAALSSQDLPLMAAKLDSDASTTADAVQTEATEQATAAATALAKALHEGVRSLMEQGMEFRALAVRREASLKAALEASERARLQAEEHAVSSSSSACRSSASVREEEANLAIAEQEICEALVGRLQAQVRTLEMQVECMDCELKAARSQAAEWEQRHKTAMAAIQHMQQDPDKVVIEPHEMSFKQRRAIFQKPDSTPEEPPRQQQSAEEIVRLSTEIDNWTVGSLTSPSGVEGCGAEGLSLSPSLSPSSPLTAASILGSRTTPLKGRPLTSGSPQRSHSPTVQQPSWTVAGSRTALCAEVRAPSSPASQVKQLSPSAATP
jgi:hypothetical protein